MTVVIHDSLISELGSHKNIRFPKRARIINCSGKYLIPGLWDMHVHMGNATRSALPMFIASGVTGVRDMGTRDFDSIKTWRRLIRTGQLTGPRIISPGPILNGGHPEQDYQIGVNTADEAKRIVDSLAEIGVDFIKVHSSLTRETYFAIADEAKKRNLPFAGHIPISNAGVSVTGEEASMAGQKSLEHMLGIPFARDTIKMFQNMYPTQESLEHLFAILLKNKTYVTPTLSVYVIPAKYKSDSSAPDTLINYISPELKAFWDSQIINWPERDNSFDNWLLKARMNMIPLLRDAGIPLLSGTDTGFPFVIPGFGLQEELIYLVDAGLSPPEALRTATINPARYFGTENWSGSIEKGKIADLVILNADPTSDIHHIHSVEAVIMNGKYYDHSDLAKELIQITPH
jgi:imidazolonepropionase-like amidohydrolase